MRKAKKPVPFDGSGRSNRPGRVAQRKYLEKQGLPPGTLVHVGHRRLERVRVFVTEYDDRHLEEKEVTGIPELNAFRQSRKACWFDVRGLHDPEIVGTIGQRFGVHPLVLEDVMNATQRPKFEESGESLFLVMKILHYDPEAAEVTSEHMSLILGSNYVLTFRETEGDEFDRVRERLRSAHGRLRTSGTDYLAYCLIDSVVDNYFVILEQLAEKIELVEDDVVSNPTTATLRTIHTLKKDIVSLRRSLWPLREAINRLSSGAVPQVNDATIPYLRDVYDHTIHVSEAMETYRDIVSGMLDIYLSGVSNRLNEIMKVLTIIATIFIPLTFVAGWYGMNFKSMPEYDWRWGYIWVISLALGVTATMLLFFRRRHWI
ncbi:MAG: magnesium/cobalt transporter CorA [Desulfomonile tiedjei]|nr:magnesium/cobalt transporter CorA [Desulfomonile tiedjei]